jgi:enoyl-CoA hydratase/carnithine racemase
MVGAVAVVEVTQEAGVLTITLNRPDVLNALNREVHQGIFDALERAKADDSVRAVVITGAGRGFCVGQDLQEFAGGAGDVAQNLRENYHRNVLAIRALQKPVIAAVNGAAAGLGCDMALACDFILASEQAAFTMSFVKRGLVSDGGGMYFLPRRVGLPRAKELIFTGRVVDPKEALAIGLADRVTAPDKLIADALAWARDLTQGSSVAVAFSKSILDRTFESTEEQVFALGREAQAVCYTTDEHRDAVAAFLNKAGR